MLISLEHYLILSIIIFCLGFAVLLAHPRNLLIMLRGVEVMLLGCLLVFICFAKLYHNIDGLVFALVILTLSATKLAVGISLLILYFRHYHSLSLKNLMTLKR